MKKTKLLATLMLALILLVSTTALAEEPSPWQYDGNNSYLKVVGTLSGEVAVPAAVDGYAVSALKNNAFYEQHEVTSLTMPESLRALQSGAFSSMNSLTSVTLNDGLEVIGYGNFSSCPALTSLTIPASVRIFNGSIAQCENLKEIRFEGECPIFLNKDFCFWWMPDDYVIYVPDDQLDAYAAALADCGDAARHLQPSGKNAVTVQAEDAESWYTFDAATGTITGYQEYHAFLEIPASIGGVPVKAIGEAAFKGGYSVYGVVFPEGLERIEASAFERASNIDYIQFPSTLRTIGDYAFYNVGAAYTGWSEGLEEIGAYAFTYSKEAVLALPSTVKTIGESAFEGSWLNELYLSGNLESIGPRAFANCFLSYMAFDFYEPIDIAADAFADNASLADLDLPWDSSFENRDAYIALLAEQCPGCTVWINNPISGGVAQYPTNESDITTVANGVWEQYHGDQADLTIWTAYDDINVTALGDGLFKGSQTIRSFYPHHCGWFTTIGNEAFADSSVEYVELFGTITTIGDEAFRNCANIAELTIPESVTSIGAGAFRNCTGITELTLPASLTYIGEGALDGCDHLAKLTVLCDPAILPDNLLADCFARAEIYAAPDATKEQVARLSALAQRPWYAPVSRVGEPVNDLVEMPYAMLPGDDFWYDEEYARLDRYNGYELNLYLPREIDGVELTMIGGTMMSRATYGDNFDVELPVVSLVIPENYTEIPAFAFMDCDALETVICYAPIENLAEGMFKGCTNLREVVFVNGVRNLDRYVFSDCLSLETVYLGAYVDTVSELAFKDEYDVEYYNFADCITDPAQMPDIDALLQAVQCDPMPEPETETEYESAPAEPVGAEGEPYFGTWTLETMEMEGMTLSAADMGLTMVLTLNADGTASMYDGEETSEGVWTVTDGVAYIDGSAVTLTDDGKLCMEDEGVRMLFGQGDGAPAPAKTTAPEAVSADAESFIGTWAATTMEMEGMVFNVADVGMVMELTLNADGTAIMYDGEETDNGTWSFEDGAALVDGIAFQLMDNGSLCMEEDGAKLYFSPAEQSGAGSGNVPSQTESTASMSGLTFESRLERKFLCTSAEVSGFTMEAAMLGGEYSMTFHADGTVDFVMVGTPIPGLTWTQEIVQTDAGEATAFVVDYYGNKMEAVWTEEGFDMNYFDSMLMHYVPEE